MRVILLVALGSPNSLNKRAIKEFLAKFLMDKHVVKLPRLLWYPLLHGLILPLRSELLFKKYQQVWLDNVAQAPLIYYTKQQAMQLQQMINNDDTVVHYAFMYAYPQLTDVLTQLQISYTDTLSKITIVPLYPQFSTTTSLAVFTIVANFYRNQFYVPDLEFIHAFHDNQVYIDAIVTKIKQHWQTHERGEKLIFSYHSLPLAVISKGDPYYQQCLKTTQLIADKLGLNLNDYRLCFQSKFGYQKWLTPTTQDMLKELAQHGVTKLDIVCPGFMSDCLETLEEVAIRYKRIFLANGGEQFQYIECLNDSALATEVLASIAW